MKRRVQGIATFVIPTNKEQRDLSSEERIIQAFVDIDVAFEKSENKTNLTRYQGHHLTVLKDDPDNQFYCILPYYIMSEKLGEPQANSTSLDKTRRIVSSFLKSNVKKILEKDQARFEQEGNLTSFFKATANSNYLKDIRANRFIYTSLANLLWNLQHPV